METPKSQCTQLLSMAEDNHPVQSALENNNYITFFTWFCSLMFCETSRFNKNFLPQAWVSTDKTTMTITHFISFYTRNKHQLSTNIQKQKNKTTHATPYNSTFLSLPPSSLPYPGLTPSKSPTFNISGTPFSAAAASLAASSSERPWDGHGKHAAAPRHHVELP